MPLLPASLALHDDRVVLRDWRKEDAPALAAVCGDPDVCMFTSVPWEYERSAAERWIEHVRANRRSGTAMALAIAAADDDVALGNVNLVRFSEDGRRAALGYWLAASARNRGLATRAARLLCDWGFDSLGLVQIELAILPENRVSQRVAERLGAVPGALRRNSHHAGGRWWDMMIYTLSRSAPAFAENNERR